MNGLDPQFLQYLVGIFPQLAGLASQNPVQAPQAAMSPQAPQGFSDPARPSTGLLSGVMGQKNPNQWSPDNAQDIMWLRQNNPGQLQTLNQQEMRQPGYDPAKAKWGQYNAGNGFGQAMMDRDMANLTGTWHSGRS